MYRIQVPTLPDRATYRRPFSHSLAATVRTCFLLGTVAGMSVTLTTSLWALEEESSKETGNSPAQAKSSEQDDSLTVKSLTQILVKRQYEQAIEKLEAFRKDHPDSPLSADLDRSLISGLRYAKPEIAIPQYKRVIEQTIRDGNLNFSEAACLSMATSQLVVQDKELLADEKLSMLDRSIEKLSSLKPLTASYAASMVQSLTSEKIRQLASMERYDDAKKLFDTSLATATQSLDDGKKSSIAGYLLMANDYFSQLRSRFPDESETVIAKANDVAEAFIRRDDIKATDFLTYLNFKSVASRAFTRVDVDRSVVLYEELNQSAKALEERLDEAEVKKLATYSQGISSLKRTIDAALKHQQLIGTLAPEIDGEHFVATKPVMMSNLRGKVVLIDFWAVWCGPCIATFPHLIEWHEKYAEKGLVILGATNRYNYRWDDETNKATRAPQGEEVSIEEELAMLEKFREQHKLHHGFFVTPKGSRYSAEYGVTGIPQAALIDKEGKVQMIRIGSGSANAIALEAKIQELLEQ
jgi:thiol-disulfide isomerase/thioredoxin